MKRAIILAMSCVATLTAGCASSRTTVYSSIYELEGTNAAGIVLTVSSGKASFWMDEPGYPLQGIATQSATNLTIHYPAKSHTQNWKIMQINDREWLFGPIAEQHYQKQDIIVPFDAIVRLSGSETTNNVPRASDLGVKAWEQKR